jgi:DNA-binding beta-propeller fold protein YncE
LFITARGDNALLSFNADRLPTDTSGAVLAALPLPAGPVGLAVLREERRVVVANARRFSAQTADPEVLTVVDAASGNAGAILGRLPLGGGPVDLSLTRDGRFLLVANFEPHALTILSVANLPTR